MAEVYTEKVSWNLAAGLLQEIQLHLIRASNFYLAGNLERWFYQLKAVKMRIISSLNQEERLALKNLETEIMYDIVPHSNPIINRSKKEHAALHIETYNESLFDMLEKYGYLVQKQEDRTRIN